jgi:uncharacterized protein (TIGR02231 family)
MNYEAIPVLTSYVYRTAEITNTSEVTLLDGPLAAYLDGRFVGKSELGSVAPNQSFTLGFGTDGQLKARREMVKRDSEIQGGNERLTFTYKILIDNYKKEPAKVSVYGRMPKAAQGADVQVTLGKTSDPLSTDKLYESVLKDKGILRWDIEVPAGAEGANARPIEFSYTIEYDKRLGIALDGKEIEEKMLRDYESFQKAMPRH